MITKHDGLLQAIEWAEVQTYRNNLAREAKDQKANFRISSYMDCGRQWGYRVLGLTPDFQEDIVLQYKRSAIQGNFVHGIIQDWLNASGVSVKVKDGQREVFATELPLSTYSLPLETRGLLKQHHLSGRIDGIIQNGKGDKYVLEIKTVSEKYFQPSWEKYLKNKLEHFESQLQMYMHLLGIYQGYILLINQERFSDLMLYGNVEFSDCMTSYLVEYDGEYVAAQLTRLDQIYKQVSEKELPAPEPGNCKFCKWYKQCPATKKAKGGK